MTTVDNIKENFPEDPIPRIQGEPSFETIAEVHRVLNSNASSVPTMLGGGRHGYLGLTITHAAYVTLTGQAFVYPINPGPVPVVPANSRAARIAEIEHIHRETLRIYNECQNVGKALKKQLLEAVDDVYFRSLRSNLYGYANVTVLDLLTNLYTTYGNITPHELQENDKRIRQPYDVAQPFEIFTAQIEDSVEYANAGGTPFSAEQVLSIAYTVLFTTGAFKDECKEWRKLPQHEQTWPRMKNLFGNAHRDLRREQTAAQQGYGTVNNVQVFEEINTVLEKLATATLADKQAMANLAEANAALTKNTNDIKHINQTLKQLQASLAAIHNTLKMTAHVSPPAFPTPTYNEVKKKKQQKGWQWCWTHGMQKTHNSGNCQRPAEGHKKLATIENMMGSTLDGYKDGQE